MLYAITLNHRRTGFLLHAFRSIKDSPSTENLLESSHPLFTLFQQARSQEAAIEALQNFAEKLPTFRDEVENTRPNQPARTYTYTDVEKNEQFGIRFYISPHDMRKAEALDLKAISLIISLFRQRGPHARSVSIEQMLKHIDPNFFTVKPTPSSAP